MGGEQPTLRVFGGGIDPAAADPGDEDEVHARKQFVVTGGDRTITDLGVRLERDLVERLDPQLLKTGEERRRLRMHPQQADWADAMYIRAEPTDENRKFDRTVMQYDGYPTVGMPRAWLRNEVVNGINNPFHNADSDDYVVLRYLPEGAIEIYPEEVYEAHPYFVRIRAAPPVVRGSSDDSDEIPCFNLAASTPYDGQMFEIVPFDWKVFCEYFQDIIGRDLSKLQEARLTPDEFTRVLTAGGVKPCSTPLVLIDWGTPTLYPSVDWDLRINDTRRFRVVLPAQRKFYIRSLLMSLNKEPMLIHLSSEHLIADSAIGNQDLSSRDENDTICINRKYIARIDDQWWGHFFDVPDQGPPIIYIPADTESTFIDMMRRTNKK